MRPVVYKITVEKLTYYFEEHPDTIATIAQKCINAQAARDAAKKAMEAKRKSVTDGASLPGKLADCSDTDPEKLKYISSREILQAVLRSRDVTDVSRLYFLSGARC